MSDKKERFDKANEDAAQTLMRKNQVVTVRYKVYIFFLGIFLFVFWPTLVTSVEDVRGEGSFVFSFGDPLAIFNTIGEGGLVNELNEINNRIEETADEIDAVKIEKKVITHLSNTEKQNTIINCLNNQRCDIIDERLFKELKFLRVFMMMNYLGGEKMSYDQKTVLRSINEFLNKTPGGLTNGKLQGLKFGNPEVVDKDFKINKLMVTLSMEFDHKRNLISFLENIEDKVFTTLPVLYVIDTINYDIVNYTERQAVNIGMNIYYFDGQAPVQEEKTDTVQGDEIVE